MTNSAWVILSEAVSQVMVVEEFDDALRPSAIRMLIKKIQEGAVLARHVGGDLLRVNNRDAMLGVDTTTGYQYFPIPSWDVVYSGEGIPAKQVHVEVRKSDLDKLWPSPVLVDRRDRASGGKRGRKPKYDWPKFDKKLTELFEYHGEFVAGDNEWSCQADAKRAMEQWCKNERGEEPCDSMIREHIADFIAKRTVVDNSDN